MVAAAALEVMEKSQTHACSHCVEEDFVLQGSYSNVQSLPSQTTAGDWRAATGLSTWSGDDGATESLPCKDGGLTTAVAGPGDDGRRPAGGAWRCLRMRVDEKEHGQGN